MNRFLVLVVLIVLLSVKTYALDDIKYTIEKNDCVEPYKCSYDIRINSKKDKDELLEISQEIFDNAPAVENVFISFYLPCMKIGYGAWANMIFNPLPNDVKIMEYMLTSNPTCSE